MVAAYQKFATLVGRLTRDPTAQSVLLLAVAVVGLMMDSSLGDLNRTSRELGEQVGELDKRVAAQTEVVAQLKIDLQVLKATGQAESARLAERIGAIEQRQREMETRQRERDAVFDMAARRHERAMEEWAADEGPQRVRRSAER